MLRQLGRSTVPLTPSIHGVPREVLLETLPVGVLAPGRQPRRDDATYGLIAENADGAGSPEPMHLAESEDRDLVRCDQVLSSHVRRSVDPCGNPLRSNAAPIKPYDDGR
jgi:hypothetical protein